MVSVHNIKICTICQIWYCKCGSSRRYLSLLYQQEYLTSSVPDSDITWSCPDVWLRADQKFDFPSRPCWLSLSGLPFRRLFPAALSQEPASPEKHTVLQAGDTGPGTLLQAQLQPPMSGRAPSGLTAGIHECRVTVPGKCAKSRLHRNCFLGAS